jgi:tungstate transport system ATP-binding protein
MNPAPAASDLPIRLEGVHVNAGGTTLLRDVNLRIAGGAPTVLIGPNGSGKTTLLRVAMGLVLPQQGRVSWGAHAGSKPLRAALVFQRPVMLRRSVQENLDYALAVAGVPDTECAARATRLLALVGLDGLADRPAPRLSGGERQRLAIARALARDPEVLLLDEPTASLDPMATQMIEELIRMVSARGVKVVMATHDLGEARRVAGEILLLHRGEIMESGPADQVLSQPQTDAARRFVAGQLMI